MSIDHVPIRGVLFVLRFRTVLLALVMLSIVAATSGAGLAQTPAADSNSASSAAGFIVDTGEGEPVHVVVTFSGQSISAIDLLRKADLSAVTVEFGGLGEAVCSISETGCDVSDCRQRLCQTGDPESPFWQYWQQEDDGSWSLSQRGASHIEVGDGDIAAWAWTGVDPELETLSWDQLVSRAGAPETLAQGNIDGDPATYVSEMPDEFEADASGITVETLAAIGIVVLLGSVGGWLVLHQRRSRGSDAS